MRLENVTVGDSDAMPVPHVAAGATVLVGERPPWDVNGDGVVDLADIASVAQRFGGPVHETPRADVNSDGTIDILDLITVAQHFGESEGPLAAPMRGATYADGAQIARWIAQGRAAKDGSMAFERGLAVLEGLLREIVPPRTSLLAAYPNPFNPDVWIPYELSAAESITVTIYDANATAVRRYDLGVLPAGLYTTRASAVHWDGRNAVGERATSGAYFIELRAGSTRQVRRIILRK